MSLLNDALRKKTSKVKIKEAGNFYQNHTTPRNVNRRNIFGICGLPLLLTGLVFGIWYLWGALYAQIDTPIAASTISKDIKITEPDLDPHPSKGLKQEIEDESAMPKPKGEIASLDETDKLDSIEKPDPPSKARPGKVSPPPKSKVDKNPRRVKTNAPQKDSGAKEKTTSPQRDALFFRKALRYHRQGNVNQAVRMYQQVLRAKPGHRDALFNLASAYIQLTAYSEALPLLRKLRSYDPENPEVLVNQAIVEIGLGKAAEAIHLLDLAAKQYEIPKFEICFHRAAALSRLGRLEEALLSYKTAEELNPEHITLNYNLAVLCDKLHKYTEAVNYYRVFLRRSDNLPQYQEKKIEFRIRSLRSYLVGRPS